MFPASHSPNRAVAARAKFHFEHANFGRLALTFHERNADRGNRRERRSSKRCFA
jgi:hypothetical protein